MCSQKYSENQVKNAQLAGEMNQYDYDRVKGYLSDVLHHFSLCIQGSSEQDATSKIACLWTKLHGNISAFSAYEAPLWGSNPVDSFIHVVSCKSCCCFWFAFMLPERLCPSHCASVEGHGAAPQPRSRGSSFCVERLLQVYYLNVLSALQSALKRRFQHVWIISPLKAFPKQMQQTERVDYILIYLKSYLLLAYILYFQGCLSITISAF